MVRVHRRCAGRGPTRAKAFYRDDVVVVLLEDALTKGERSLVDGDRRDAALTLRRQLQMAMRAELITAVEDVTARGVVACLTDTDVERDLTAQVFVLDGAPDAER